ncbi:hypothetical protein Bca101_027936 [Brassica carinata]
MTQLDSPLPKIFVVIERIARAVVQWGLEREKIILEINHHIDYAPIKSPGNKNVLEVERWMIHFRLPKLDGLKPPPPPLFTNPPPDITAIGLGLIKVTA